ncbi:phosphatidylinositol N-acetylglucosaminyltransferase subunit Q [Centruroides vittatus]|uniref:phosphatidylinositol N-acetylglucosaminyltransferase subunit Q n=1 Tax=Centruroides vittatus TaxID=120091 RepID=UPI003510496D
MENLHGNHKPVFIFVMESFTLIGMLGVTFLLTLFNDLISLATIHIYCFYGYAARLFGLQALGMSALWRLFWGKKWNPLRQRVDSYTYDVHQLFLGTLMFTILLFLLPTVMLYYIVFTVLRLLVLMIQGIIGRTVNLLNTLPAFVILLRLMGSSRMKGDVQFTVATSPENGPTILYMKVIHIPYMSVVQMTLPSDETEEQKLSWKFLLSSLIWGRIIYPL